MLYLYLNVREKTDWNLRTHVLRTSSDLRGKAPDWDADFCPSFSGKEKDILMKVLSDEDLQRCSPNIRRYGWMRFPDYAVERLIVGCMACDIDLEVINWR